MKTKRTKIVCTLGPATQSINMISKLVKAGMNVARLNFSHGTHEEFSQLIKNIRLVSTKLKKPIGIIQDLQGPKIRVGEMPTEGHKISKNNQIILSTKSNHFSKNKLAIIPVQYKSLHKDVKKNDLILIEDGLIELKVNKVIGQEIYCDVINNGLIKSHKGINVPTASISANPLTSKDLKDLEFGLKNKVDFVALSFVRTGQDIKTLRKIIEKHKSKTKIIAKIERHEAVKNLQEILEQTDAVMVARGDLGVEIPAENVPIIQKRMIHLANFLGKPVITATEMLQSMIENPRATRAEISDAANAIYDRSDALMLSNETAVGKYPIEAVETLTKVSFAIENEFEKSSSSFNTTSYQINTHQKDKKNPHNLTNEICHLAVALAQETDVKLVVALTESGYTAKQIAKERLLKPIITITTSKKVEQELTLVWGLNNVFVEKINSQNYLAAIKKLLIAKKLIKIGEKAVIISNASQKERAIFTITF